MPSDFNYEKFRLSILDAVEKRHSSGALAKGGDGPAIPEGELRDILTEVRHHLRHAHGLLARHKAKFPHHFRIEKQDPNDAQRFEAWKEKTGKQLGALFNAVGDARGQAEGVLGEGAEAAAGGAEAAAAVPEVAAGAAAALL